MKYIETIQCPKCRAMSLKVEHDFIRGSSDKYCEYLQCVECDYEKIEEKECDFSRFDKKQIKKNGITGHPVLELKSGDILFQPYNGNDGSFVFVPKDRFAHPFVGSFNECLAYSIEIEQQ